jgi:hypothetical protein
LASVGFGQAATEQSNDKKGRSSKNAPPNVTAEQVAESVVLIYGFPGGRERLNQIRKTAFERGKLTVTTADGRSDTAAYQRWTSRPDDSLVYRVRIDQQFPSTRYSLVYDGERIFGIFNDGVFTPREDAAKAFENQMLHSVDALLRYKENESAVELAGREKHMGVEYYLLDMTDKQGKKTRYYVSVRSFRVMMLDYEYDSVAYRRKFYNYKYAQGTLVPYRSVLTAGDRTVEEIEVGTITFGQRVDDGLFASS